uniref:Uncharacterized protein n=1 Tax=Panthera tigris altaica TaxID=74533 RepID=A0A8C9KNY7_PANTA
MLDQPLPAEQCTQEDVSSEDEDEEMPEDTEDLDHYEMKEEEPAEGKKPEDDGIGKENLAILEKIKKNQRQDYLNVRASRGEAGPRGWRVQAGRGGGERPGRGVGGSRLGGERPG